MRWLCRLVTPPNGVILDPYMGSGSTGKAALLEGFRFVGMEMDQSYFVTAHDRISWALKQRKEGKQDEVGEVDQEETEGAIEQAGEGDGDAEGEEGTTE